MNKLMTLLQARAGVQVSIAALAAKEQAGDLTAEEIADFDKLSAEFDSLSAQITRLQKAESAAAAVATPVAGYAQPKAAADRKPGEVIGIMVRSIISGKGDPRASAHYAETSCHAPDIAAALNTSTGGAGGFIVPPGYVPELIDLLRPASVVRKAGARVIPMPAGTLTMPKLTGGSTATYGAEGSDATKSEETFGQLNLSKKKLTALVPVSNDLIRYSSPQANEIVRDDIVQGIGTREDQAFLRDDGTGNTPKGLRYQAAAANVIAASATVNLQNVSNDLGRLELALMQANVKMIKPVWVMAPRTLVFLTNLRDGNGNKVFPEIASGTLRTAPFAVTTSIPVNLGGGGDESEIYLVDMNDAIIGEATSLILAVSEDATYKEGATLVSAFSRDETVVRAITEHDFGMRYDLSVAVLTAVKWKP